jgi:hypothetical protein
VKSYVTKILNAIFKILFRLSSNMESETEYFPLEFYRNLVYENQIFDIAKLLDIAAIFGSGNNKIVN